jgi:hypothetical protein
LVVIPLLLLLCLGEEWRGMRMNIAPTPHHCWVSCFKMKMKHETRNMKYETLRIASSLVYLFTLYAFLFPLALFYCARKNNKECQPPPLSIFVFVLFMWTVNIIFSPPLACYSFSPSCVLYMLPFLLLCLCKED